MQTIQEFCARHDACRTGREWALANCNDMLAVRSNTTNNTAQ
jgi:hypothetical protein